MVSSKGKPTDPKLREEVKEEVKQMPNKDGGGKGQMAAWKAGKISQEYEKKGGGYENEPGSKNEPSKGAPKPKSDEKKAAETKGADSTEAKDDKPKDDKPKANSGKKAAVGGNNKSEGKAKAPKKAKKAPTEGTRKSSRLSGKRSAPADTEEKPAKKSKSEKK